MGKEESTESNRGSPAKEKKDDGKAVPLYLPVLEKHLESYPKLKLESYQFKKDGQCSNVLALEHNAMKREIADLVTTVIPCLENEIEHSIGNSTGERWENIHRDISAWWKVFLQLMFFMSEQDGDLVNTVVDAGCKYLKSTENLKRMNALQRKKKSILDRFSFSTEIVIRAAERALVVVETSANNEQIDKLIEKLSQLIHFILDTMEMVTAIVKEVEDSVPDYKISGLENSVVAKLSAFAKDDKAVFIYIFARWMNDDACIKRWITRYGGWRGKSQFKSWEKHHADGRGAIIDRLLSSFVGA